MIAVPVTWSRSMSNAVGVPRWLYLRVQVVSLSCHEASFHPCRVLVMFLLTVSDPKNRHGTCKDTYTGVVSNMANRLARRLFTAPPPCLLFLPLPRSIFFISFLERYGCLVCLVVSCPACTTIKETYGRLTQLFANVQRSMLACSPCFGALIHR